MNALRLLAAASLITTLTSSAAALAADDASATPKPRPAAVANERVVTYVAAWNERDAKRRRELVAMTWDPNGRYVDAHRRGQGHDAIDAMIEKAQQQFPGYRLRLVSGIEAHNSYVRFSWAAGGADTAPLYLGGTDFAEIGSDGRFLSVTGFVDAAPAR